VHFWVSYLRPPAICIANFATMNDKDYSPLSTACVRALQDKLYEKRKAAAVEIEKFVFYNSTP